MPIPISTTTISVLRLIDTGVDTDPWGDDYGTPTDIAEQWATVHTGVRAALTLAGGSGSQDGTRVPGDTEVTSHNLVSDPIDLSYRDRVIDEYDGRVYSVVYSATSPGIAGLSNTQAALSAVQGFRSNP